MNKFVNENIDDLFKPKSQDEIMKNLEIEHPLYNSKEATDFLRAGILRDDIHMVNHALNNNAKIFYIKTNLNYGMIWTAINDYDESKQNAEKIIIEILKHLDDLLKNNKEFQQNIVEKSIYHGLTNVLNWVLNNYGQYLDPFDINLISYSPSTFKNNDKAHDIINKWLDKNDRK